MKNRHLLLPFIVGILAFVCFSLVAVLFAVYTVQPHWERILLLILPSLVFCGVGILAWKGFLHEKTTTVLTIIFTLVFLVLSAFYVAFLMFLSAEETTDPKYYERAYHQIEDGAAVKGVFPASVPEDAQEITFSYRPQFLQGDEAFQFSYRTTEEQLNAWEERLKEAAEWVGSNAEWHRMNKWGFSDADSMRYHLYWDGGYNHGEMCYALLDRASGRIGFCYSRG